jgi:hypothetical protein
MAFRVLANLHRKTSGWHAVLSSKTGSNGEMSGRGEDSDAEDDKQGYRSGNGAVKVVAR